MRAELTASSVADRYMYNVSPSTRLDSKGGFFMYSFSCSKACRQSSDQLKSLDCRSVLKNERHFSADLEMNQLSKAILPVNHCTSFFEEGCLISTSAPILSRFISILRCVIRKPKNLLESHQRYICWGSASCGAVGVLQRTPLDPPGGLLFEGFLRSCHRHTPPYFCQVSS